MGISFLLRCSCSVKELAWWEHGTWLRGTRAFIPTVMPPWVNPQLTGVINKKGANFCVSLTISVISSHFCDSIFSQQQTQPQGAGKRTRGKAKVLSGHTRADKELHSAVKNKSTGQTLTDCWHYSCFYLTISHGGYFTVPVFPHTLPLPARGNS